MNRDEYLDLLRYYLKSLPKPIVEDIILDYETHFNEGIKNGRSEEDIAIELGSPRELANEYLENEDYHYNKEEVLYKNTDKETENSTELIKKIILGIVIFFALTVIVPVFFGLLTGFIGLIIGALAVIFSLIVSALAIGFSTFLSLFIDFSNSSFIHLGPVMLLNPITRFFLSTLTISIALILINLVIKFFKFCVAQITKLYQLIKWNFKKIKKKF